jgi:probable phosphoglycerate mutase
MSIWLARHGETELNAARIVQPPDTPLSARGRLQAQRLAERLRRQPVAHILSSDQARARMTAEIVQAATGAQLELEPLLAERNFGDIRGTPYARLSIDIFAPDYCPPGGESWEAFFARVDAAWERVERRAAGVRGDLVVVSHGLVCRALAQRRLLLSAAALDAVEWNNTCVTRIDGGPPWVATLVACTAHLDAGAHGPAEPGGPA